MQRRSFTISLAGLALVASMFAASTARAADVKPQRSLVFTVHQETLTHKRVVQETDVSQAYNGINDGGRPRYGTTSAGSGGGHTRGAETTRLDETVKVDVVDVMADGVLGCTVSVEASGVRSQPVHAYVAGDGTVKWDTKEQGVDPTLTFLMSLLATRLVPHDAAIGTSWAIGREKLRITSIDDEVARLDVSIPFGSSSARGGEQTGWVDYVPNLFVPTRAEFTVRGRVEMPSQSADYERRVMLSLVSDSKQPTTK